MSESLHPSEAEAISEVQRAGNEFEGRLEVLRKLIAKYPPRPDHEDSFFKPSDVLRRVEILATVVDAQIVRKHGSVKKIREAKDLIDEVIVKMEEDITKKRIGEETVPLPNRVRSSGTRGDIITWSDNWYNRADKLIDELPEEMLNIN